MFDRFSKFTQLNILIIILIIIIAFVYPIFIEKVFYSGKANEAISISKIVENIQNVNYINHNQYIAIKKGDIDKFNEEFSIAKKDIKYYNYSIFTTPNSYTLYAEPKIMYLKNRDISPKIFTYYKKLNNKLIQK